MLYEVEKKGEGQKYVKMYTIQIYASHSEFEFTKVGEGIHGQVQHPKYA